MIELLRELHGDRKFEIFTNFEKKKQNNPKFGPVTVESIPFEKLENLNKEKRFKFLQPLQIFISNKIIKLKLYVDHLIKRIESAIEYRKLLRQKREQEELPRVRYLRKQKLKSFKNNLKQKIHSLFHSISLVKTEEEKLPEKDRKARLREEKRRKEFRKQRQKEIKKKKSNEVLPPQLPPS